MSVKVCNECGRVLPRQAWRPTCATCRKPPEKRLHMRAIYHERQLEKKREQFRQRAS